MLLQMAAIILSPALSIPEAELMLESYVYTRMFYREMSNDRGESTPETSIQFCLLAAGKKLMRCVRSHLKKHNARTLTLVVLFILI